ncbi:MAG: biopolymer transporter ExbD [Gammaproteobacteria bacterium]|nr:biopolymer transporter ExbD [Gammaproteobacteria bacterium]
MRRRHRRLGSSEAELDITAFMNLMIVLVPVLLLGMVFTHTSIIDLNFPGGESLAERDPDSWQLQVIIRLDEVEVRDSVGGSLGRFPHTDGQPDTRNLRTVLQQVKARAPEKRDAMLLPEPGVDYQQLVSVMDTVRSYPSVVVASVVSAELFPQLSLGDAPLVDLNPAAGAQTP